MHHIEQEYGINLPWHSTPFNPLFTHSFITHDHFISKNHRWNVCLVDLESLPQCLNPTSNTNFRSGNVRRTE